ncbi:Phosphoglycolate phosphatase [bioreactor metagenome]|uniref:Phosphoglycolate phosphatase n=1 Tax=bioreactor metagenome TaxID=1076179 RepID=A0A645AUL0_9ZZZZ
MFKEIIFDFDGTVADSFGAMMEIFEEHKQEFGFEKFGENELKIYRQLGVAELIKKRNISVWKILKILRVGKKLMNQKIKSVKPFKEMKQMLMKLKKKGLVLGIISTNSEKNISKFLKKNKIDVFDYVVGKGSLFGKTRVIKNILKTRKLNEEEVLYVGDEVRDIQACKKIGIKIAAVTWGFSDEKLLTKNKPDYLIKNKEDLIKTLNLF